MWSKRRANIEKRRPTSCARRQACVCVCERALNIGSVNVKYYVLGKQEKGVSGATFSTRRINQVATYHSFRTL